MRIEIQPGYNIYQASELAVRHAKDRQEEITFSFNDIELRVMPGSWPDDIAYIYNLNAYIYNLKCTIARMDKKS